MVVALPPLAPGEHSSADSILGGRRESLLYYWLNIQFTHVSQLEKAAEVLTGPFGPNTGPLLPKPCMVKAVLAQQVLQLPAYNKVCACANLDKARIYRCNALPSLHLAHEPVTAAAAYAWDPLCMTV